MYLFRWYYEIEVNRLKRVKMLIKLIKNKIVSVMILITIAEQILLFDPGVISSIVSINWSFQ